MCVSLFSLGLNRNLPFEMFQFIFRAVQKLHYVYGHFVNFEKKHRSEKSSAVLNLLQITHFFASIRKNQMWIINLWTYRSDMILILNFQYTVFCQRCFDQFCLWLHCFLRGTHAHTIKVWSWLLLSENPLGSLSKLHTTMDSFSFKAPYEKLWGKSCWGIIFSSMFVVFAW